MKTALLAQNEALEAKTLNPSVGKSMLPLSHTVTYPVDVEGAITPICCVEVVPSDSYKISNEILLRQLQPLKVPVMTRYTLNTAYFYCSNRLGYKKWEMFLDQANRGRADVEYTYELPRMANKKFTAEDSNDKYSLYDKYSSDINYKNTIHTYLRISMNRKSDSEVSYADAPQDSDELPLAFAAFDYQIICRDFYTNIDRIPDNPDLTHFYDYNDPFADWAFTNLYPADDDEIRLLDGVNIKSGFNSGDDSESAANIKGFVLDKTRYHDLRYDYFSSSKRAPMRGEAPTVDSTMAVSSVDASNVIGAVGESLDNLIGINATSKKLVTGAYSNASAGSSLAYLGVSAQKSDGDIKTIVGSSVDGKLIQNEASVLALKSTLEKLKINLAVTKKINAAEIILLNQLTLWQTLNMLSKPYYNDFLNSHFENVKVGDSLAEKPFYIGGTSQVIDINEVIQTSQTTESAKLGSQAAIAHSLSGSYVGEFFAQDFGFIIGVAYILPDLVYDPAMPRWASRRAVEDYYFPEFSNLSMQATLNKELFYSNDDEWNNLPLGYVGAYDELRSIPNYCAGDLLNDSYSDLKAWVLRHDMSNSNKPAINQKFLTAKDNVDMSAWTVPTAPKFMLQCANYIEAMRPMPYIAIPKLGN